MANKTLIKVRPWCPFCGQEVEEPREPVQRKMKEFKVGTCQCGAVYTSDPTGFNVGSAMVECLVYACNDNWDFAWELTADDDYLTSLIENYDEQTHQIYELKNVDGRKISGVLYFVRLTRDFAELSKAHKAVIEQLVLAGDIDALVDFGFVDAKTIRCMQRLFYDPAEEKRWFCAHVIGQVCARLATRQPGMVSDLLHRMFESCTDSASTHWGLLETIGAIIAARPDIFGGFARHLLMYRDTPSSRVQVLWAMGTIAEKNPEVVRNTPIYSVFPYVNNPEPVTRAHAIRLLGRIKAQELQKEIEKQVDDKEEVTIYEKGLPVRTTVGDLAREALSLLADPADA
ncbi:MAG: PBS lyase [Deltaproteobacteria bacterium]|nr:PBS lyase [Deltaproteobacteria bacterium]